MEYRVLRPLTRRIPAEEKGKRPRPEELAIGQVVDLDPDEAERLNAKSPQPALEPVAGLKAERVQVTEEPEENPKPAPKRKPRTRKTPPAKE